MRLVLSWPEIARLAQRAAQPQQASFINGWDYRMTSEAAMATVVNRIGRLQPSCVVLFGSQARGVH